MIGIDEVGRGAWAGPLVVAGCYFTENPGFLIGLNDSKVLTKKRRESLESAIKSATIFEVVVLSAHLVDSLGLTACIKKAIMQIVAKLPKDSEIMLDGKYNFLKDTRYEDRSRVEIGADGKYASVMAASIIAKVERDRLMLKYDKKYPGYGFATNVGYGTTQHRTALKTRGICKLHRRSYRPVKELLL